MWEIERKGGRTDSKWVNGIIIWSRQKGGGTTGTWVWTAVSSVPRVYQCIYWTDCEAAKDWGEKKGLLWEDDMENDSFEKQFKNVTGLTICCCIVLFLFFFNYFFQQWWQMSVKFKWKTSRTIFKWSSIGLLEGLTICPLVSGEKRSFLSFILIIKNYKAFFNFFVDDWETCLV